MKTFEKIYKIVSQIPKGKVMTYRQVADFVSIKNPRIVGFALHGNKNPRKIPCHRVVHSDGTLAKGYAFGGASEQKKKLEQEGIKFLENGKIDLKKSLFCFIKKH